MVQFNLNHEKFILDYPIDRIIPPSGQKIIEQIRNQWKSNINNNYLSPVLKLAIVRSSKPQEVYDHEEELIVPSYNMLNGS